jgi:hypothetical protein
MVAKLTRLTHKIAIQLHLVAESCTIFSSRSRWPVRKLLDTSLYLPKMNIVQCLITVYIAWRHCVRLLLRVECSKHGFIEMTYFGHRQFLWNTFPKLDVCGTGQQGGGGVLHRPRHLAAETDPVPKRRVRRNVGRRWAMLTVTHSWQNP